MKSSDFDQIEEYVQHFRGRVLQDALTEATADYWRRRAETFAAVGNARCDEVAQACRNRAAVALLGREEDVPGHIDCMVCGTPTSPWSCSCGQTRVPTWWEVAA